MAGWCGEQSTTSGDNSATQPRRLISVRREHDRHHFRNFAENWTIGVPFPILLQRFTTVLPNLPQLYAPKGDRIVRTTHKGFRTTLIGIAVNILLAGTKGAAGILGNSYALIADAIESTTDIASSLIVWGGLKISIRPPDVRHPYGHGKAEPIAAIVVSLTLIGAAIGIGVQSANEVMTPHHMPAPFTLSVLALVVITKEILFRFVIRVGEEVDSTAVRSDAWHHRSDAITSAAAFVGISISLIGGEGYAAADDWAALFASCIIGYNACRILFPAVDELMDAAPSAELEAAMRATAQRVHGVMAVEKCFLRKMGLSYYIDMHVTVEGSMTVREGHDIASNVRMALRTEHPVVAEALVHIEPSDFLTAHSPGAHQSQDGKTKLS
jgi:cation diffusion facilitator family transporter